MQESDRGCYMCQLNTAEMKKQIGCIDVLSKSLWPMGVSPGQLVIGDISCLRGRGFESQHRILDGLDILTHLFVVKIVLFVCKRLK